ncbi:unnamed protein product [Adineta steineri]|uniref:Coiled-coil domain-containing protein 157 n=2 Tax=Adineta steineri TaxID=433720 RepID=A0A814F4W1_9BILA|nr:unnamed protein product [Adineta steineri]CAF3669848.1 unnamed protein product [Adineta steineri]
MAHLLGSKACIDSLRVDIDDLQNVIYDIVGKTGSIKCHSWKFPDKIATDIDMKELLQRYQYGKNEVDNQVSHIVLFEIIIDRLLLVLHGSWRYLHEIQTNLLPNSIDLASTANQQSSLSVGLVVKKYWNKLLHLSTVLQQHENERKRPIQNGNKTAPLPRSKTNLNTEKRSQTNETSLGPCQSCLKLQQCLRDHGDSLINLCHTYNLPSSLAQHRCSTTEVLSSDDINHWSDCQTKDIDRLSKHLQYLNNTLNKTKSDLQLNENRCKKQDETNQRLQQLINDDKQSKKVLQELHDKKVNDLKKDSEQQEQTLSEQIKSLTNQKIKIEEQLKEVNNLCASRGEQIEKLESSKNELRSLIQDRFKSDDVIKTLEQDRIRLQTELDLVKRDLDERNRELQKERTRIENMIRQEQNYQSKQKALTTSYEELTQECELLKKQVTDLEISRDEIEKNLETVQKQNRSSADTHKVQSLMETNNHLLQEISILKSNLEQLDQQLQQMEEREQMLLQYPDLNGPIDHGSTTNNIVIDMQNQMRTNEIRVDLLRKQNESLKISLEKLLSMHSNNNNTPSLITEERYEELRSQSRQEQPHRKYSYENEIAAPKAKPTPLWLLNNELPEQQQAFTETRPVTTATYIPRFSENDYVANGWIKSDPDVILIPQPNVNIDSSPKSHDRSWTTSSTRTQTTDLIITSESRPPTVAHSSRSSHNGRTSTIPPASDYEMIIGKGRTTNRPTSATKNRFSANDSARRDTSLPKSSRTTAPATTKRSATSTAIHQCATCNKSYDDKRNYDIHKLYCRT